MAKVFTNDNKVYVGNVSRDMTESELRSLFKNIGNILSFEYKGDFAFVEYRDADDAQRAIQELNGEYFAGRRISVDKFRYHGGDSRYRRSVASSALRSEWRMVITGIPSDTVVEEIRQWAHAKAVRNMVNCDIYKRHGACEGLLEFTDKRSFEDAMDVLHNTQFLGQVVEVHNEQDFSRHKWQSAMHRKGKVFAEKPRSRRSRHRSRSPAARRRRRPLTGRSDASRSGEFRFDSGSLPMSPPTAMRVAVSPRSAGYNSSGGGSEQRFGGWNESEAQQQRGGGDRVFRSPPRGGDYYGRVPRGGGHQFGARGSVHRGFGDRGRGRGHGRGHRGRGGHWQQPRRRQRQVPADFSSVSRGRDRCFHGGGAPHNNNSQNNNNNNAGYGPPPFARDGVGGAQNMEHRRGGGYGDGAPFGGGGGYERRPQHYERERFGRGPVRGRGRGGHFEQRGAGRFQTAARSERGMRHERSGGWHQPSHAPQTEARWRPQREYQHGHGADSAKQYQDAFYNSSSQNGAAQRYAQRREGRFGRRRRTRTVSRSRSRERRRYSPPPSAVRLHRSADMATVALAPKKGADADKRESVHSSAKSTSALRKSKSKSEQRSASASRSVSGSRSHSRSPSGSRSRSHSQSASRSVSRSRSHSQSGTRSLSGSRSPGSASPPHSKSGSVSASRSHSRSRSGSAPRSPTPQYIAGDALGIL